MGKIRSELKQIEEDQISNFSDTPLISIDDISHHISSNEEMFKHFSISMVVIFLNMSLISSIPKDNWETNPIIYFYVISILLSPVIYSVLILNYRRNNLSKHNSDKFMMRQLFRITRSSKQLARTNTLLSSLLLTGIIVGGIFISFSIIFVNDNMFKLFGPIIWIILNVCGSAIFGVILYYGFIRLFNFERMLLEYGKMKLDRVSSEEIIVDSIPEKFMKEFDTYNVNWVK